MARHLGNSDGRRRAVGLLPVLFLVAGMLVVAVPLGARLVNDWRNARAVSSMSSTAQAMDEDKRAALLANAHAYNDVLAGANVAQDSEASGLTSEDVVPYGEQLDAGIAAIAWVEISKIGLSLPIYRGTGNDALAAGVGHLEGTSLPVGGTSTHCVLTGHSGLATNRMFDDIRRLSKGDVLVLHVLGEELAYEIFDTEVVWPDEMASLGIVPGDDLVTLVTCTPYGVNDHRLLVHARRCELPSESAGDGQEGQGAVALPNVVVLVALVVGGGAALLVVRRHGGRD